MRISDWSSDVCSSDLYQLSINGRETTASLLNPGWTDYRKTVLYNSYDVTEMLQPGANALGVMLGNGMYNVEGVEDRYKKFVGTFGQLRLIAQLAITYEDGSREIVVSDDQGRTRPGRSEEHTYELEPLMRIP